MLRAAFCFACLAAILSQATPTPSPPPGMALIPGATFQIGIDTSEIPHLQKIFDLDHPQIFEDELPKHTVTMASFYLDKNLVTNADFKRFVDANPDWQFGAVPYALDNGNYLKHWKISAIAGEKTDPAPDAAQRDHPVVNVNWYAASAYCAWAGKRLPSEAEWELAARSGSGEQFPWPALFAWGNQPPDKTRVNFGGNLGTTSPVGSYPANAFGLTDMAGNVWQFLADDWANYSAQPATGAPLVINRASPEAAAPAPTAIDQANNNRTNSNRKVIRGGSYDAAPLNLWLEYRDSHPASNSQPFVGFRCAQSANSNPSSRK